MEGEMNRSSQCSSLRSVAQSRMAQILGSKPQMSSLIGLALISQPRELQFKLKNSTFATFCPTLKSLRFLEEL
jgi:hypothetical protein